MNLCFSSVLKNQSRLRFCDKSNNLSSCNNEEITAATYVIAAARSTFLLPRTSSSYNIRLSDNCCKARLEALNSTGKVTI